MTFKEKLEKEHPEKAREIVQQRYDVCPYEYGYEERWDCSGVSCCDCWNRETHTPMTAEEAWDIAKKLFSEFSESQLNEIFGEWWNFSKLMELSPYEAKAKIEGWEINHIQVGDVCVFGEKSKMVVTKVSHSHCYGVYVEHPNKASIGEGGLFQTDKLHKTGKHIDIQSILEQIGKEE